MLACGCSQPVGDGLWNLKVGGKARLIAEPGEAEVDADGPGRAGGRPPDEPAQGPGRAQGRNDHGGRRDDRRGAGRRRRRRPVSDQPRAPRPERSTGSNAGGWSPRPTDSAPLAVQPHAKIPFHGNYFDSARLSLGRSPCENADRRGLDRIEQPGESTICAGKGNVRVRTWRTVAASRRAVMVGGGSERSSSSCWAAFLGFDPRPVVQVMQGRRPPGAGGRVGPGQQERKVELTPEEVEQGKFVKATLAMTEDVWNEQFAKIGRRYRGAHTGPVLRPGQYRGLRARQLGRRAVLLPGRPEGLYRPHLLRRAETEVQGPRRVRPGVRDRSRGRAPRPEPAGDQRGDPNLQRRADKVHANRLSVMLELQADFFAGVWAHHIEKQKHVLEQATSSRGWRRRHGDRRRRPPEAGPGLRRSRLVHSRFVRPAGQVVQQGAPDRRRRAGRHLQRP